MAVRTSCKHSMCMSGPLVHTRCVALIAANLHGWSMYDLNEVFTEPNALQCPQSRHCLHCGYVSMIMVIDPPTLSSHSITIWSPQHKIIWFKIVNMTGNIAVYIKWIFARMRILHLRTTWTKSEKRNATEFALSGGQGRNCEKNGAQMTLTGWSAQPH